MKKVMSLFLVCIYILMLGVSLIGCGKSVGHAPAPRTALGLVIAPTACSQGLNLSSPLVEGTVEETILNYGWICVVNADGEPSVVANQDFDIDEAYKSASDTRLKMDARSKTTGFLTGMSQVIADHEEVDYLKSIQLCARTLSSLEGYDNKVIIVVGTGLSTTGVLNFRNNLLTADPEAIANALDAQDEIPDLEGVRIYWQQLGDTAAPQADLNGQQRNALQGIWTAIIQRGGGEVEFDQMLYKPVSCEITYPQVSTVDLPVAPAIGFEEARIEAETDIPFYEPVSLTEEQIRFEGDSARYVDSAASKEVLSPIAELLISHPDVSLLLCGCIAGDGTTQYGMHLSLQRAEAVRQTLMELSVPGEQLIVLGLGTNNPWHIHNAGYTGDLAAQNRRVVLLNAETELAQDLLSR